MGVVRYEWYFKLLEVDISREERSFKFWDLGSLIFRDLGGISNRMIRKGEEG